VPLRPLGVGEILDGAFTYIRRYPKAVLGIAAAVAVASSLVQLLASVLTLGTFASDLEAIEGNPNATPGEVFGALGGALGGSLVATVIGVLFQTVGTGLLTIVMARAVLGRDITAGEAWQRSKPLLLPLLGMVILTSLGWGFGLLLCLIPGIFLYVMWSMAAPALMLERLGVMASIRRSWQLVSGSFWRTFGLLLLGAVISTVVSQAIATPFSIVGLVIDGFEGSTTAAIPWATLLLSSLGTIVATAIVLPFNAGVVALIYTDLRIRREAFDLELVRATMGTAASTPQSPIGAPPMPSWPAAPAWQGPPSEAPPTAPPAPPMAPQPPPTAAPDDRPPTPPWGAPPA
jgi:hypothetical protein